MRPLIFSASARLAISGTLARLPPPSLHFDELKIKRLSDWRLSAAFQQGRKLTEPVEAVCVFGQQLQRFVAPDSSR